MQLTLSTPAALYALALVPVLALLLLMMPRSRRVTVGSLAFWTGDPGDAALSRSARRRLDLASVVLLCALAVFIIALSGPTMSESEATGPAGIILFDRSPSVLMHEGDGRTRLLQLREAADTLLAGLPPELPVSVEMVPRQKGDQAIQGAAEDVRAVLPAAITVSALAMGPRELRREVAMAAARRGSPVVLLTDLSPYDEAGPPEGVHVFASGGRAENMAITAAMIADRDGAPHAMVETFSSARTPRDVTLRLNGQGLSLSPVLTVLPGTHATTVPLPRSLPERVTVQIDGDDAMAADNVAELTRVAGRRWRVGLIGQADPMLLRFFALAAQAEVFEYDDATVTAADLVDVTFFVNRMPSPNFRGPAVLVNPPESDGPLHRTSETAGPGQWEFVVRDDPLVDHMAFSEIAVARRTRWRADPGATVVARFQGGDPVIARYGTAAGPRVAVLADIDRGNTGWSARPSYVTFWRNVLLMLSPRTPTVERHDASNVLAMLVSRVEGRQVAGPAFDEREAARRAFTAYERAVHPTLFPLWPPLAALAGLLVLARVWIVR